MRYESPVTSVSWIPSEAVESIVRYGFDAGVGQSLRQSIAGHSGRRGGSGVPRPHLLGDAVTACRVASADASQLDAAALGEPAGS
jgi:hypothetical protein